MAKKVTVEFITKPDCHLCDDARAIINPLIERLQNEGFLINFIELNMLDEISLIKKYSEDIPVVLINGKRHSYWTVDGQKLETGLRKKLK